MGAAQGRRRSSGVLAIPAVKDGIFRVGKGAQSATKILDDIVRLASAAADVTALGMRKESLSEEQWDELNRVQIETIQLNFDRKQKVSLWKPGRFLVHHGVLLHKDDQYCFLLFNDLLVSASVRWINGARPFLSLESSCVIDPSHPHFLVDGLPDHSSFLGDAPQHRLRLHSDQEDYVLTAATAEDKERWLKKLRNIESETNRYLEESSESSSSDDGDSAAFRVNPSSPDAKADERGEETKLRSHTPKTPRRKKRAHKKVVTRRRSLMQRFYDDYASPKKSSSAARLKSKGRAKRSKSVRRVHRASLPPMKGGALEVAALPDLDGTGGMVVVDDFTSKKAAKAQPTIRGRSRKRRKSKRKTVSRRSSTLYTMG